MSSWEISQVLISEIEDHPNADRLSIAKVDGYEYTFIVGRDQYQVGDVVVYIPEGSVITEELRERLNLPSKRVKMIRLRGVVSQGLLVDPNVCLELGEIYKEEDPDYAPQSLSPLPPGVCKYDLENAENYPDILKLMSNVVITEKLEGTNCSACVIDGKFYVNSRNKNVPEGDNFYWEVVKAQHLDSVAYFIGRKKNIILRGEIIGPGIQGNIYDLPKKEFRLFDIELQGRYLNWSEIQKFKEYILQVPLICEGKVPENLKEFSNGRSVLNINTLREGVVIKPKVEIFDPHFGRVILKQRSPEFLS